MTLGTAGIAALYIFWKLEMNGFCNTVSVDGKTAISLNFSRLSTFRPGFGHCNLLATIAKEKFPDISYMWQMLKEI